MPEFEASVTLSLQFEADDWDEARQQLRDFKDSIRYSDWIQEGNLCDRVYFSDTRIDEC